MQSRSRGRRRARRNPAWVSDTAPCGCLWLGSIWALSSLHPPSGAFRPWSFTLLSLTPVLPASGQASSQPDQMSKHSVCHQPVLRMSMVHVHISWRGWGGKCRFQGDKSGLAEISPFQQPLGTTKAAGPWATLRAAGAYHFQQFTAHLPTHSFIAPSQKFLEESSLCT